MVRVGQRLGKYRLRRRVATGGFATVYEAYDTLEDKRVALKVPLGDKLDPEIRADFEKEIRISARLDHPNILSVKTADVIDGVLAIAYPLGERSLADRMQNRMSVSTALNYAEQMLEALAYAHSNRVIHCDVKPDNLILFEDGTLKLGDFGLAKQSVRTMHASSSGTLGYVAPEQAMGRPSARSDVFSAGLIIYRLLTGKLPDWPYDWPPPGYDRLRRNAPDMVDFLRRSIQVPARKRFRDADQMLEAFLVAKQQTLRRLERRRRRRR